MSVLQPRALNMRIISTKDFRSKLAAHLGTQRGYESDTQPEGLGSLLFPEKITDEDLWGKRGKKRRKKRVSQPMPRISI
jgi:hypothetical protein